MAGKPSFKTQQAMALVRSGECTPYQAAKQVGIALSTIYRSTLYNEWNDAIQTSAARLATAASRKQQPSEAVRNAVQLLRTGSSVMDAACAAGVARATLYQSPLYRKWKFETRQP